MLAKSQIVLYIYDRLINRKEINAKSIIDEYNISLRTFRRYIAEINAFLCNNFRNECIIYDCIKKSYILIKNESKVEIY